MWATVKGRATMPDRERMKANEDRNKTSLFEGDDGR